MGPTCVIVDDSEEFLASARRLLEADGVTVLGVARNGADAMALTARAHPDVVLVDVELGRESGFDIAAALQTQPVPVPVIMISTHSECDLADLIESSSAIGFLGKSRLSGDQIVRLLTEHSPGT